jgi:hypothetical protein
VTSRPSRSVVSTGAALLVAALLSGPALASPAHAVAAPGAVDVPCAPAGTTPTSWRSGAGDAIDLNAAERAQTRAELTATSTRTYRAAAASLAPRVLIPVYVHVIKGTHHGEQTVSATKVRRVMSILRGGYAGAQAANAAHTRYTFTIKKLQFVKNDKWYHATPFGSVDRQAKRTLHRGGARSLNLYINDSRSQGLPLLGYSRFPWQYHLNPALDGVTVNVNGLPGGKARGYNLGDTVIHEVGHWLGLFHTFEGGCSAINDGVSDTPAERDANFRCSDTANLCDPTDLATKIDPAYNFMDYTYDSCMRLFTPGQAARMDAEFARWRR